MNLKEVVFNITIFLALFYIVKQLKSGSKGCEVILAADDDREGEAIAWHCANVLKKDTTTTKRML